MHVKDGKVIGYYCDKHMKYPTLKEDSMNDGLYRASRWFRIGEFKEKNLREVLEKYDNQYITLLSLREGLTSIS